jgi:signal transduction histidine kinase
LQVLHGEIERLKQKGELEIAADISSLAEVMRRHVDRELARARLSYSTRDASANVKGVVDRVVRVVERTPQGLKLDWATSVSPELVARINADDLAEVLGNLIENAARHAKEKISISATANDEEIAIVIGDDGPGIAEEQWPDVMERGGRLDMKSEGAGLGLAISQDILEACGGNLSLRNEIPGFQAVVRIRVRNF